MWGDSPIHIWPSPMFMSSWHTEINPSWSSSPLWVFVLQFLLESAPRGWAQSRGTMAEFLPILFIVEVTEKVRYWLNNKHRTPFSPQFSNPLGNRRFLWKLHPSVFDSPWEIWVVDLAIRPWLSHSISFYIIHHPHRTLLSLHISLLRTVWLWRTFLSRLAPGISIHTKEYKALARSSDHLYPESADFLGLTSPSPIEPRGKALIFESFFF